MLFIVSDDSPASGESPSVKVELDIEDAPFLQEAEEKPPPPKAPEPAPSPPAEEKKPSRFATLLANKKRLALIAGGVLLLLLAPIAISLLLGGEKPAPVPETPVQTVQKGDPPRQDAPAGPKFLFKGEPFLIERRGSEGELRFLRCRFSIPTDNPVLYAELQAKNIAVRDAIYYYLNNKPLTFLSDNAHTLVLKTDLISVINEHISAEKIQELYIEEYLVSPL